MIATSVYLYQKRKQKKLKKEEELKRLSDKHDYKLTKAEDEIDDQFTPSDARPFAEEASHHQSPGTTTFDSSSIAPPSTPPPEYSPAVAGHMTTSTSQPRKHEDSAYGSQGNTLAEPPTPSVCSTETTSMPDIPSRASSNRHNSSLAYTSTAHTPSYSNSPYPPQGPTSQQDFSPVSPQQSVALPATPWGPDTAAARGRWVFVPDVMDHMPLAPAPAATLAPYHQPSVLDMPAMEDYQAWPHAAGVNAELPAQLDKELHVTSPVGVVELPADVPDSSYHDEGDFEKSLGRQSSLEVAPLRVPSTSSRIESNRADETHKVQKSSPWKAQQPVDYDGAGYGDDEWDEYGSYEPTTLKE